MYRDDAEAARLRIAALEQENAELRRAAEARRAAQRTGVGPRRTGAMVIAGVLAVVGTVAWASAAARAPRPAHRATSTRHVEVAAPAVPATLADEPPASIALSRDPEIEVPSVPAPPAPPAIDPAARALEPAHPDVIEILDTVERGGDLFVLHRHLRARAWEHAQRDAGTLERTLEDYEDRLVVCEEGADDDENSARCQLEEAPSEWIGLRDAACDDVHAIEVARLARADEGWVVAARVLVAGPVCAAGIGGREPELRAADVDRDGHLELTVIAPFAVPSSSYEQDEGGTIGAVLDARDLHAQLVVLREYDGSYGDYETASRTVATTWHFDDIDGDGSIEAHVRQRTADVDEVGRSTDARTADCRYQPAADRWACAEAWLADPREAAISGTELRAIDIVGIGTPRPRR
jgi:hypothetical protein